MVIEEKSSLIEGVIGAVGVVIVILSTLSAPRLSSNASREELAKDGVRKTQRIKALQTWLTTAQQSNDSLRSQLVTAGSLLEKASAQINTLTAERDGLKMQVASATTQLKNVQGQFEELKEEMAKYKEILSVQQAVDERDDALERAKKAEDRIRELTLELKRAGVWP
jgi:chromosome segregation ATPase